MSETTAEAPQGDPQQDATPAADGGEAAPAPEKQDGTDWKAEARKWEQRAKENRDAARELEKQKQASMTEAERAVAEAEARGRQNASSEFGKRLARSEFDARAGRRNPDADTAAVFDYLDLSRFVGDDGEPDVKAIDAAVERLIPAASGSPAPASFDGGARTSAPAPASMSSVIRRAAGRA